MYTLSILSQYIWGWNIETICKRMKSSYHSLKGGGIEVKGTRKESIPNWNNINIIEMKFINIKSMVYLFVSIRRENDLLDEYEQNS